MKKYIGIDVHSKNCVYVSQDEAGKVIGKGEFATTQAGIKEFGKQLAIEKECVIGMETWSVTYFVAQELRLFGGRCQSDQYAG